MLNCKTCELLIADSLYQQLTREQEQDFQEHLKSCPACRVLHTEIVSAHADLIEAGVSARQDEDVSGNAALEELWSRLNPELDSIDAARYRELRQRRWRPLLGSGLAVAASLALLVGVPDPVPVPGEPTPVPQAAQSSMALIQVNPELMSYLTRVQTMLMQVANASVENGRAVSMGQPFARDMAAEAGFLTALDTRFTAGQSRLLKDIEFLLMQFANLDESNMADGVELMQQYLQANSILLKIRMLEMRPQPAAPETDQNNPV